MQKKTNRAKLNLALSNKEYKSILFNQLYPIYWDECIRFYPKYKIGFKNTHKTLMRWEQRMFRNWKHNRKKQYKNEKNKDI